MTQVSDASPEYPASQWGAARRPSHPLQLAPPLALEWRIPHHHLTPIPLVVDGLAVVATGDRRTMALDLHSGTPVWKSTAAGTPLLVHRSFVLTVRAGGGLRLLQLNDGTLAHDLGRTEGAAGAVGIGDLLVCGSSGSEWCYDIPARAFRWMHTSPGPAANAGVFAVAGDRLLNGEAGGTIRCLSLHDGALVWQESVEDLTWYDWVAKVMQPGEAQGPLRVHDNTAVFTVRNQHVVCLGLENGERRWFWRAPEPSIVDGHLSGSSYHVLLGSNAVVELDATTGSPMGHRELAGQATGIRPTGPFLVSSSHYWLGSRQGRLLCFDRAQGRLVWDFEPGGARTDFSGNAIIITGDRLFYGDDAGQTYCLKPSSKQPSQ